MAEINDLNITDASNTARFPEAMAPSAVNDGARALEGLVARWHENINTSIATTGSANAYVLAAKGTQVLFDGLVIGFDANFANTGAATLNVDSTGVKNILKHNDVALASGDIEANQKVIVVYDGTSWQMLSPLGNAPGDMSDLTDDTTPQLSGFLDANSQFISHSQGANIASVAGDTNIWAFDGNTVHITGANAITDFGTPKSAGNFMWLIFDAAASVVDSATITVAGNTNYQAAANDLALVYALTTSTFLFMPFPNSGGSPVASSGGLTSISNASISAATNVDITGFDSSLYDNYEVWISNGQPGTDAVILEMETSTDGGTSFDTGVSDYSWAAHSMNEGAGESLNGDTDDSEIQLTGGGAVGNAANENVSAKINVFSPETTEFTAITWSALHRNPSTALQSHQGSGERQSAADVDALRFHFSGGDWLAQGSIQFLGIAQ
jgi:hypothetical protein